MEGLFLYIILIVGFALVCASIMWFAMDLRKAKSLLLRAETEKNELRSIISDAEMMVNELNSFSGYLLEKIDQKNSEAGLFLDRLDESMRGLTLSGENSGDVRGDSETQNPEDWSQEVKGKRVKLSGRRYKSRSFKRNSAENTEAAGKPADIVDIPVVDAFAAPLIMFPNNDQSKPGVRSSARYGAILSRNKKYIEVLRHNEEGMDETEIARTLNIGRGEVALILGLREGGAV